MIRAAAQRWGDDLRSTVAMTLDGYLDELIDRTGFLRTAQQLTPDLLEEISGISTASGVPHRQILALNLMDEDWWVRRRVGGRPQHHCTTVGLLDRKSQPVVIGQNMDLPPWMDGLQLLLSIRPQVGPPVLAPTIAGMVATNAMNASGLGICVNTLAQLPTSAAGLPVAFILRRLARESTLPKAAAVLRALPHASGQNYLLGSRDGIVDLECGATGCREMSTSRVVIHTNHPLAHWPHLAPTLAPPRQMDDSHLRLEYATRRLTQDATNIEELKHLLRQAPVCRGTHDTTRRSVYSVLMHPHTPNLELAAGPLNSHLYERYDISINSSDSGPPACQTDL